MPARPQDATPATPGQGSRFDLILDVRSKLEFWLGHLPGAECVPVHKVGAVMAGRTDVGAASRIFVYCASGSRSAVATAELRRMGFKRVVDGGGMAAAAKQIGA